VLFILAIAYAYTHYRCGNRYGVGPILSTRTLGAVAERNRVRAVDTAAPTVHYTAASDYIGTDSFTYSVTVGGIKSEAAVPVNVHVRKCRLRETGTRHALCDCTNPINAAAEVACYTAVTQTCSTLIAPPVSLAPATERLPTTMVTRSCQACASPYAAVTATSYSMLSPVCLYELHKLSTYLETSGYCAAEYSLPLCRGESADLKAAVTEGLERSGSYMLNTMGQWQSEGTTAIPQDVCQCTQSPLECPCRYNAQK
jgi:hypothetical protein